MFIQNYSNFNMAIEIFAFCDQQNICAQNFDLSNEKIVNSMLENQEVILQLIKIYCNNANDTQKKHILSFLKHVIVDKDNFVLITEENTILRFIYYVNEFKDFQKISYKKDFLNFNPHNYFKTFSSKGKIRMINLKNPNLDKNHRFFIIEKKLFQEFKDFIHKNYFFDLDINQSYIYSSQKRQTKQNLQKTYLSDILDFVKRYHSVDFDYDKASESFEYYEYLIATYFEYYVNKPESLLDFLEHKIDVINDISTSKDDIQDNSYNTQYYLDLILK